LPKSSAWRTAAPPSERPARIQALEGLALAALDRNEPVERRSDASPAAVLQVKVVEKPAVRAKEARVA
jgi:hypothetical protein